jgi:hypothetical protein
MAWNEYGTILVSLGYSRTISIFTFSNTTKSLTFKDNFLNNYF